jgi:hypothetical protein
VARDVKSLLFITIFLVMGVFYTFYAQGQSPEGGLMEAKGILQWVKMTNFPDNPWKELAIVDENEGEIIAILIGTKVEELLDKEGVHIVVRGLPKPEMSVKGKKVTVIEVKQIEFLK